MKLNISQIMDFLPHRYPFLLVDRIENIVDDGDIKEVIGYKNVTYNEPFFQGHFPDEPIMPGVLILEAMGQVGAILLKLQPEMQDGKRRLVYLTTIEKAKFRRPVKPGDQLRTEAKLLRRRGNMGKFYLKSTVDGEVVAEGEMGFTISSGLTIDTGDEK